MSSCELCGYQAQGLLICPNCGADLVAQTRVINPSSLPVTPTPTEHPAPSDLSEADEIAVSELPRDAALLVVKRGPQAGSRFLLDSAQISVGRAGENEIFLDDVSVSRRHALFQRVIDPDGTVHFSVSDIGSLNGTYVNRDRIEAMELASGDEVQIGKFRLVFYPGAVR